MAATDRVCGSRRRAELGCVIGLSGTRRTHIHPRRGGLSQLVLVEAYCARDGRDWEPIIGGAEGDRTPDLMTASSSEAIFLT